MSDNDEQEIRPSATATTGKITKRKNQGSAQTGALEGSRSSERVGGSKVGQVLASGSGSTSSSNDQAGLVNASGYRSEWGAGSFDDEEQVETFNHYRTKVYTKEGFRKISKQARDWVINMTALAKEKLIEKQEDDLVEKGFEQLMVVEQEGQEGSLQKLLAGKSAVLNVVCKEKLRDEDEDDFDNGGLTNGEVFKRLEPTALIRRIASLERRKKLLGKSLVCDLVKVRQELTADHTLADYMAYTNQGKGFDAGKLLDEGAGGGGGGMTKASVSQLKYFSRLEVIKKDNMLRMLLGIDGWDIAQCDLRAFMPSDAADQMCTWANIKDAVNNFIALICHLFGNHLYEHFVILSHIVRNQAFADLAADCIFFIALSVIIVISEFWNKMRGQVLDEDGNILKMKDGGWVPELEKLVRIIRFDVQAATNFTMTRLPGMLEQYNIQMPKKGKKAESSCSASSSKGDSEGAKQAKSGGAEKRSREVQEVQSVSKKAKEDSHHEEPGPRKLCVRFLAGLLTLPKSVGIEYCHRDDEDCRFSHDFTDRPMDEVIKGIKANPATVFDDHPDARDKLIAAVKASSLF